MRTKLFALMLALGLAPFMLHAHDGVHVENAYALETPEKATVGAVFMDIKAPEASENDALIKVISPRADRAEIHTVEMDDMGVAKMRPLEKLIIPMKKVTSLKQGGDHIMLMNLSGPLRAGDTFPVTLTFERGQTLDVLVTVKAMNDATIGVPGDVVEHNDHHHGH